MIMAADQQAIQSKPTTIASTEKSISNKKKESLAAIVLKTIAWIGVAVIGIAGFQYLFALLVMKSILPWADRSAFGEMFGGLNTFFSGLAFAGVIYAILLQRKELKLQREELELTRNELKRSAEAQEESQKALKDQVAELVNQRRLSILPGFILQFKNHFDRPDIKNIGSGVALNIRVDPIPLPIEGKWAGISILLHPLSHVLPNENETFALEFLGFDSPEDTNKSGIGRDPNATQYLASGEYEVTVTFSDIEGNQYTQQIMMSASRCRPKIVKPKDS
jgi:hypothetical protein